MRFSDVLERLLTAPVGGDYERAAALVGFTFEVLSLDGCWDV